MVTLPDDRERIAWWAFAFVMVGLFVFVLWSFVGTVVFGVFLYYGMRPLDRRLKTRVSSDAAANLTLLLVALSLVLLLGYTAVVAVQQLNQLTGDPSTFARFVPWTPDQPEAVFESLREAITSGTGGGGIGATFSALASGFAVVATGMAHFLLSLLLAFLLLREDARIAAWYRDQFGSEGSAAHAYAQAVDKDLHEVYVGNVLTVAAVTVLGFVVYDSLNFVAPPGLAVPVPALLALLTGVATLVPLVVGKIIYVPVGLLLAVRAVRSMGEAGQQRLWFPIVFVLVCFFALDFFPVAILRPYIAGRHVHSGLMVFAYLGGTMLFGWYGLFLGPLLVVLGVHLARIVLPELVHGEPVTYEVKAAESLGSDPESATNDDSEATDE